MSEDRRWKTEDGGQRAENGDQTVTSTADEKVGKDDQRPKRDIIALKPMMRRAEFEYGRLLLL